MTYYVVISAIPNEHQKKSMKKMNAQQQKPIQQSQSLRPQTTNATEKSFVDHIVEKPTATQRLIDNGLPPSAVSRP